MYKYENFEIECKKYEHFENECIHIWTFRKRIYLYNNNIIYIIICINYTWEDFPSKFIIL